MAIARLTPGVDHFDGQQNENNVFLATPGTLNSFDTITGTASATFHDVLALTGSETVAAAQFAGVTLIEALLLSDSGITATLTDGLVAGTDWGLFAVFGGSGHDTIDASGVTNGTRIAFFAGGGNDSFTGGNGNDYFEFAAADLSADTVAGGSGFDCLALSTGGAIAPGAIANVSGIDAFLFSNSDTSITLSDAMLAGLSVFSIIGGNGNDTVDAATISSGVRIAFYGASGHDNVHGGSGSDYLAFAAAELTAADQINGSQNYDLIEFTTAGALSADAFTNVTGIDALILNAGGNSLTLTNGMVAGTDNGVLVVLDGAGSDTVNAAAVLTNRVVFVATSGDDSLTGGGGSDVALFGAADLNASDSFNGGAGFDILQLTTAGAVGAAAFTNLTGIDELYLSLAGSVITLSGNLVASSDNGVFVVHDEAGSSTVDASAATLGGRVVFNAGGGANNTYIGGNGSDFFQFNATNLNSTDTLTGGGGAGTDFLVVKTAGSVSAADLANVTQMEVVQLQNGGSLALSDTLSDSGSLEADGTGVADAFDGSAVTSFDLVIKGNGGADTLTGGAGNDQVFIPDTSFVAIDGNGGIDKAVLTSAFDNQTFDLAAHVARMSDLEVISLEHAAGATLNVTANDVAQINASGKYLYVLGGSDDQVLLNDEWTLVEINHANPAVSASHQFVHYHNSAGLDLYVDDLIAFTVNVGIDWWDL